MVVSQIKALVPASVEPAVIKTWYVLQPIVRFFLAGDNRFCCVCNSQSRFFLSHGPSFRRRQDVVCPVCLAHDRHRLAWHYLSTRTNLLDGSPKQVLHFAPETIFIEKFKHIPGIEYLSADLSSPHAMVKMDITAIDLPDASVDIVYCSHVLEHIPKDRQAMGEIFRVLKPGGWALIQVPIAKKPTFEDPSITDPGERERLFWQSDHVRLYGLDIQDRLMATGFEVDTIFADQLVESSQVQYRGFSSSEPLFYCRKLTR
jgi:SAM-dependent methyltransferase